MFKLRQRSHFFYYQSLKDSCHTLPSQIRGLVGCLLSWSFCLIRFSQFFISPLMKVEAMEREVLAVDSGVYYSYLILLDLFFLERFQF